MQQSMFYDDAYDALVKGIAVSGKSRKELACIVYPGRKPETASSLLSRALSPENTDAHISIENLLTILRETRPNDFIYFLCDEFGFNRPEKKSTLTPEQELKQLKDAIHAHGLDKIFDL